MSTQSKTLEPLQQELAEAKAANAELVAEKKQRDQQAQSDRVKPGAWRDDSGTVHPMIRVDGRGQALAKWQLVRNMPDEAFNKLVDDLTHLVAQARADIDNAKHWTKGGYYTTSTRRR